MQIFWTDILKYYPERENDIKDLQIKYAWKKNSKNTLVIEMVGTFVTLIDPYIENTIYHFNDLSIKEIKCTINNH